jgi:hypothetical protein
MSHIKSKKMQLQPERMEYAKREITKLGLEIFEETETMLKFYFKGCAVTLFVYTGWHTGKSIKDGRGIKNLLKQIKPVKK